MSHNETDCKDGKLSKWCWRSSLLGWGKGGLRAECTHVVGLVDQHDSINPGPLLADEHQRLDQHIMLTMSRCDVDGSLSVLSFGAHPDSHPQIHPEVDTQTHVKKFC